MREPELSAEDRRNGRKMTDIIIIGILIVLISVGIYSSRKHFRGEGGCCGGGSSVKVKRKRLKHVIRQRTLIVEGMSCEHCKNRVESRLNELEGVSAKVNLKQKTVVVSMSREISDEELINIIEKAGYQVSGR